MLFRSELITIMHCFQMDEKKKLMVLMSRSTDHPQCPRHDNEFVRVDTYMSRMVIKPHRNFDEVFSGIIIIK